MPYAGTLYYENSSDVLIVHNLILRDDAIAFTAATTWGDSDKWEIDALATKQNNDFITSGAQSKRGDRICRCLIRFYEVRKNSNKIHVSGEWSENGEAYPFSGELTLIEKT